MTSSVAPRLAPSAMSSKTSRDSGVVWSEGRIFAGDVVFDGADENRLRVAALRSASVRKAVVVLPLVPVMPVAASLRSGWPKKAADASARARRPCSTSRTGISGL